MFELTKQKRTWVVPLVVLIIAVALLMLGELGFQWVTSRGWTTYTPQVLDVQALAIDRQGQVWVGSWGSGLRMLDPDGNWTTYTMANSGLIDDYVEALAIDGEGRKWVGTGHGLSRLDPDGNWTTYTADNSGLASPWVKNLAIDERGWVWVGSSISLSVLDPDGNWRTLTGPKEFYGAVESIAVDRKGRVWMGTWRSGLGMLDPNGNWTTYTPTNSGLADDDMNTVAIDGQGRVWVGLERGGLSMLDPDGNWTTYIAAKSGLVNDHVEALAIDGEDRIWVGTWRGLSRLDPDGTWTTYTTDNSGLASNSVKNLAISKRGGQVWTRTRLEGSDKLNRLDMSEALQPQEWPFVLRMITRLAFVMGAVGLVGWLGTVAIAHIKVMPKQKSTPPWRGLGVAGGLVVGLVAGGVVGVIIAAVNNAIYPAPPGGAEYAALGSIFIVLSFAVPGAVLGAIIGGKVTNRRLRQPHPERQSVTADHHHPPGGNEGEK